MRRDSQGNSPPSLELSPIETSNATLNAFLGGSRQKSWMRPGIGTPVRASPRQILSETVDTSEESPDGIRQREHALLLSPVASRHSSPTRSHTSAESHDPSRAKDKSPDPTYHAVSGNAHQADSTDLHTSFERVDDRGNDSAPNPEQQSTPFAALVVQPVPPTVTLAQRSPQIQQPARPNMSPLRTTSARPVISQRILGSAPPAIQSASAHQQSQQVPRVSLRSYIPQIVSYVDSCGGLENLDSEFTRPRCRLLLDACDKEDWFYVALHQLFCTWDTQRALLLSVAGVPSVEVLAKAFGLLGLLIRPHTQATSSMHLQWFANFPSPLAVLFQEYPNFHQIMGNVFDFLTTVQSEWTSFEAMCVRRRYPPLISEIRSRLHLPSPTLQRVVFTASRRNMGHQESPMGAAMDKIFLEDLKQHRRLGNQILDQRSGESSWDQALRQRYLHLGQTLHHQSRSSSSINSRGESNLRIPSEDVSRSNSTAASRGNLVPRMPHQNGYPQNAQFTERSTNRSPVAQRMQDHQSILMPGLPNTAILASGSRPPSVNGQRVLSPGGARLQNISRQPSRQQGTLRSSSVLPNSSFQATAAVAGHASGILNNTYNSVQQFPLPGSLARQQDRGYGQRAIDQAAISAQRLDSHEYFRHRTMQAREAQSQAPQVLQAQPFMAYQQAYNHAGNPQQPILASNGATPSRRNHGFSNTSMDYISSDPPGFGRFTEARGQQRNPLVPTVPPSKHVPTNQVLEYARKHPLLRSVIPPLGFTHANHGNILRELKSLHQAHLRSPRLVAAAPTHEVNRTTDQYYQYIRELATKPTMIPTVSPMLRLTFDVTHTAYEKLLKDDGMDPDQLSIRKFKAGSLSYRLRCIFASPEATECHESDWAASDTVWPEVIFLEINDEMLEIRRKLHHGKDLPVDITKYIRSPAEALGASNHVTVATPKSNQDTDMKKYFIAVEVVEVSTHDKIVEKVTTQERIPASSTLESIKNSLSGYSLAGEDDITMAISDLTINLTDPFTAQIFQTPVRGHKCKHWECFDLETYLQTRPKSKPDQPSKVDVYRCPLCSRDARPSSLRVDEFLVDVKRCLLQSDILEDTKAIVVKADGSWKPKVEKGHEKKRKAQDHGDGDTDSADEGRRRKSRSLGSRPAEPSVSQIQPVVVELD